MTLRKAFAVMLGLLLVQDAAFAQQDFKPGRLEQYTKKAAEGPKMEVAAATYFGGPGLEEFIAVRTLPDGSIVAFGNAWGPQFPVSPRATVVGKGRHRGLEPFGKDRKGRRILQPENPDIAGMTVLYDAALRSVRSIVRFDWGVASLSAATVAPDGKACLLAGRATADFRSLKGKARSFKIVPPPTLPEDPKQRRRVPPAGPYEYEGVTVPGDIFVMRQALDGTVEWIWVFEGHRTEPYQVWTDLKGSVYTDVRGMVRISPDGSSLKRLTTFGLGRQAKFLAVDPADGSFYFGGDRNTNTGKEPWRQPYLYKYDANGTKLWKIWEWPPKSMRDGNADGYDGLVSDSSARAMDVTKDRDLIVGCWSDGGNTCIARQPTDCSKKVTQAPFSMSSWGMKGANSLAHFVRIDSQSREGKLYACWVSYLPGNFEDARKRGAPNGARIRQVKAHPAGALALCGSAATLLVQTPGAFYTYPGDGKSYGGDCVVVYDAGVTRLLFSSYLPGCENASLWTTPKGYVIASRSKGDDGREKPTRSPTVNAVQPEKKGEYDGHLILLKLPEEEEEPKEDK